MILVDSSVWIAYFQNKPLKVANELEAILQGDNDLAILPIIRCEILMGFKQDKEFSSAKKLLLQIPSIPITEDTYLEAANLYRNLRKSGITIRGSIDCLIAQTCLETAAELFSLDKDFQKIAGATELKLWG